jgi:eukaryotic-like serine/threonine-protein kinase
MGLIDRWLGRFLQADEEPADEEQGAAFGAALDKSEPKRPSDPLDQAIERARERLTLDERGTRYAESSAFLVELAGLDAGGRSRAGDALLADALLVSPSLALRRRLAERLLHRGERDEARVLLEQLTEHEPDAVYAHTALGELAELQGDSEGAMAAYERVLATDLTQQKAKTRARRLRNKPGRLQGRIAQQRAQLTRFLGARAAGSRYAVLEEIGRGGAATVFRARDRVLEREVALKIFHPRGRTHERRERLVQEARIAGSYDHPHIVPILDLDESRDLLVMALCEGGSLRQRLSKDKRLRVVEAAEIGAVLLRTLADIHAFGGLHLDVKPSNMLFHDGAMMLCDFGVAGLKELGAAAGTRAYMAPEQRTKGRAPPAADLYAAGLVVYECIAGRLPETQRDERTRLELSTLPSGPRRRGLEALLSALTAERPEDRPSDARVAAEQLLEAAALPVTDADGERLLAHLRSLAHKQGDEALHRLLAHPLSALLRPAQAP